MVFYLKNSSEIKGKQAHDPLNLDINGPNKAHYVLETGPIIVGVGSSGLAVAACLKEKGVPSLILERSSCIASLWQLKTYDRLKLHLPKSFCQLPLVPFPTHFPTYPNKKQFISYLENYAKKFEINPNFDENVDRAEFDQTLGFWRVKTTKKGGGLTEYVTRWLIVATGENAEMVVPKLDGIGNFKGEIVHTSLYKSGEKFRGKKVLVVGCGNSGMEVCLDLCHYNSMPSIVVRHKVHVLPRNMFGRSTFGLSMWLLKWLPISMVDKLLLLVAWFIIGDTSKLGLIRPQTGPLQPKNLTGKTPVLDVGTLDNIKTGHIKVCPGIKRLLMHNNVEFVNGKVEYFDSIILASGYKSNVPYWLKEKEMFSHEDGLPRNPFPNGWKGENGLYAVGFTKRGLLGASMDAKRIAEDIGQSWHNTDSKPSYRR